MIRLFLSLIILFTLYAPASHACTCKPIKPSESEKFYNEADAIVTGEIKTISGGFGGQGPMIKMDVENVIKGENIPDLLTANYNIHPHLCGHEFNVGETHTLALYDTRGLGITRENTRGYGFRVMISCFQEAIKKQLEKMNLDTTKEK